MRPPFFYNIDVLGGCNLACPSCPQGNQETKLPSGMMGASLLNDILAKAARESEIVGVALFNWTEPLLHPGLSGLIRVVHQHDALCYLSANLNQIKPLLDVLQEEPHSIRISCSGFSQAVYEQTHKGGIKGIGL